MKRLLSIIAICAASCTPHSVIAQQQCVLTAPAYLSAGPFAAGVDQPTSCTVYKQGVQIATGPVITADLFVNGTTQCSPPNTPRATTPATSVYCNVLIPAQPLGSVSFTMTGTNSVKEGVPSPPYTVINVATLATSAPPAPTFVHFN